MYKLISFLLIIDFRIFKSILNKNFILYIIAFYKNIINKIFIFYKDKNKYK